MKKIIAIFFLIISLGFIQKNPYMTQTEMWLRIDNAEKQNVFTKGLAEKLLKAFQDGKIKAYYPMNVEKEMSYTAFLAHYGLPQAEIATDITTTLTCPQNSNLQVDAWMLGCLTRYLEIYETQGFNKKTSVNTHDIHYVRIIFASQCSYKGIDTYGPVFKSKDIAHLHETIYNPHNYAVKYAPKDVLKLRLFSAAYIKKGTNDYWEKPSVEGESEKEKLHKKEAELWDY